MQNNSQQIKNNSKFMQINSFLGIITFITLFSIELGLKALLA